MYAYSLEAMCSKELRDFKYFFNSLKEKLNGNSCFDISVEHLCACRPPPTLENHISDQQDNGGPPQPPYVWFICSPPADDTISVNPTVDQIQFKSIIYSSVVLFLKQCSLR